MMILTAGHVVEFIYLKKDKNEKITGSNKFELTLYFLGISILLLTHYLVARVPLVPAHILMKILVAYSLIICVLKAQLFDV